jgi:chaperonin GroES
MATTKFTPLHDRILVTRHEEGETMRGGIIIPDSAKEKPQQGTVVSVGKGKSNDEGKVFPRAPRSSSMAKSS